MPFTIKLIVPTYQEAVAILSKLNLNSGFEVAFEPDAVGTTSVPASITPVQPLDLAPVLVGPTASKAPTKAIQIGTKCLYIDELYVVQYESPYTATRKGISMPGFRFHVIGAVADGVFIQGTRTKKKSKFGKMMPHVVFDPATGIPGTELYRDFTEEQMGRLLEIWESVSVESTTTNVRPIRQVGPTTEIANLLRQSPEMQAYYNQVGKVTFTGKDYGKVFEDARPITFRLNGMRYAAAPRFKLVRADGTLVHFKVRLGAADNDPIFGFQRDNERIELGNSRYDDRSVEVMEVPEGTLELQGWASFEKEPRKWKDLHRVRFSFDAEGELGISHLASIA